MNHDSYSDAYISEILNTVKTVAIIGASDNPIRPSYYVMKYLRRKKYRVIPVNPAKAGSTIFGETVFASLLDIPFTVDMVDCFRNKEAVPDIVDETIKAGIDILWMQLGVRHDSAAAKAEAAGIKVVMNRCPKIEFGRLSGEIAYMGGRSGIISSKRQKLLRKK